MIQFHWSYWYEFGINTIQVELCTCFIQCQNYYHYHPFWADSQRNKLSSCKRKSIYFVNCSLWPEIKCIVLAYNFFFFKIFFLNSNKISWNFSWKWEFSVKSKKHRDEVHFLGSVGKLHFSIYRVSKVFTHPCFNTSFVVIENWSYVVSSFMCQYSCWGYRSIN